MSGRTVEIIDRKGVFDPQLERRFLMDVRALGGNERQVLADEVRTAAYEVVGLVDVDREYVWRGGEIVDSQSGFRITDLARRGGRDEEMMAMEGIQRGLEAGKLVVNFSPRDTEWDYPNDCVDLWQRNGSRVKWVRLLVAQGYDEMIKVWSSLGGRGEVKSSRELLSRPIATDGRVEDVLALLNLRSNRSTISREQVDKVVTRVRTSFERTFGARLYAEEGLIFRFWSAVISEIEVAERRVSETGIITRSGGINYRMGTYLFGPIVETRNKQSGGCASMSIVARFGENERGYYINSEGRVIKGEVPKGYVLCQKCGVYYQKGGKCPFCS
jgi:hypothetical protein